MAKITFLHNTCKAKEYSGQLVRYAQLKKDGHRVTAIMQPTGHEPLVLYTRSQTNLFQSIHREYEWLANLMAIPPYSSIDGELYVPGKPASYVKTAIKEGDPNLRFDAFAIPWWEHHRRYTDPLEWAFDQASQFGIRFITFYRFDKDVVINPEALLAKLPKGEEGWVLKRYHYVDWYKLKPVKTLDLVVMGFLPGKNKYTGTVGSIICGAYDAHGCLRELCRSSGMTDTERYSLSENDVGRVVEIAYSGVLSKGRLRHPRFIRWRDEKKPHECNLSQELELLRYYSCGISEGNNE